MARKLTNLQGGRWWTPDFHVSSPLLVPLIVHKTAFAILAEPSLTKATASIRKTNLAVEICCSCALLLSLLMRTWKRTRLSFKLPLHSDKAMLPLF